MKIVVDAFGGDFALSSVVLASISLKKKFPSLELILSGNEDILKKTAASLRLDLSPFKILNAKDYMSPEEDPTKILKEKSKSSMAVGLKALNAFLTAGSTGALAVEAYYNKKN